MSRYRFELATPEDDAELRRVLADTPMEGEIAVSFRREPSFFAAAVVHGPFCQTIVARDNGSERIVGFGCRSVRTLFVNGKPEQIGYLSALRVLPQYRNLGLIARGYARFREMHHDKRTSLYLTTIAEGNATALSILTTGRAGLPSYHFAGRNLTAAIPLALRRRRQKTTCHVRPASEEDLPRLLEFWNAEGALRQFFPCYGREDFLCANGTFRSLALDSILVAFCSDRIIGTLAAWDQRTFRQSVIERYSKRLHVVRPIANVWSRLRGHTLLPSVGEPIPSINAALAVVSDNDGDVFASLLQHTLLRLKSERGYLLVGLHETDPLLPFVLQHRPTKYWSRLYHVCWPDGEGLRSRLDGRTPYLELGTL